MKFAMNPLICNAIRSGTCLEFRYNGYDRVVEPHVYGRSTTGKFLIRAYQVEGDSESRKEPPWRLFDENKLSGLCANERVSEAPRQLYNPEDPAMAEIFCHI